VVFRTTSPHPLKAGRTAAALGTAVVLGLAGLLTSAPAVAGMSTTVVWHGKSAGAAQPDPLSSNLGTIAVEDPYSLEVEPGDEVTLNVTAHCADPLADGEPYIGFNLDSSTEFVSFTPGTWNTSVVPAQLTGTLTLTMNDMYAADGQLPLEVYAEGNCYSNPGATFENIFTFHFPNPDTDPDPDPDPTDDCPSLPGETWGDDDDENDVAVTDPTGTYETGWEVASDGVIEDVWSRVVDEDLWLQEDAFDGFSSELNSGDDSTDFDGSCTTRDGNSVYSYSSDTVGGLRITAQSDLLTADLARRVWVLTNDGDGPSESFSAGIRTYVGTDDVNEQAEASYGRVTWGSSAYDAVVTQLWGGTGSELDDISPYAVAGIAADRSAARAESAAWLENADVISDEYFNDIDAPVLNWGDNAQTPSVSTDDYIAETTYAVPAVAPGDSVVIVEFAHVQYYYVPAPVWTDTDLGQLYVGVGVDEHVAAKDAEDYWLVDGDLPAGIEIDDQGHLTGTPTTEGPYDFTVVATNDGGETEHHFTGVVLGAELHLELGFAVGTKIADATTTGTASGLKPGSDWTMTLHSDPITIGSGVVAANGIVSHLVSLPANTPAGQHRIVMAGVAPDGSALSSTVWFTLDTNGVIVAVSLTGPTPALTGLAYTGSSMAGGVWGIGALAIAAGLGFVFFARRRRGEPNVD